jgi:hypothetical protein
MATAVVYVRKIDGKEVFFGHAGKLYHASFIMYEKKTNSEFLGVSGIGAVGKYRGVLLQQYPSVLTTWGEWTKHYPKNKVMQRQSRGGMMGTYRGSTRPSGLVLALDIGGKTKGFDMQSLMSKGVVNDEFNGAKIAWVATSSKTTLVVSRSVGGKTLTFEKGPGDDKGRETLVDKETKSTWLIISGKCVAGKMKGKALTILPTTPFEQKHWTYHHKSAKIDR